jgi:hypothetical protein
MELLMGELKNLNLEPILEKLVSQPVAYATSQKISKLATEYAKAIREYDAECVGILNDKTEMEDGKIKTDADGRPIFLSKELEMEAIKAMGLLYAKKIELNTTKLTSSELVHVRLSTVEFMKLERFMYGQKTKA